MAKGQEKSQGKGEGKSREGTRVRGLTRHGSGQQTFFHEQHPAESGNEEREKPSRAKEIPKWPRIKIEADQPLREAFPFWALVKLVRLRNA